MNNKQITAILFSVLSVFAAATKVEGSIVVEFSEVSLTSPTLLDGTNYFEPYGLSFEDTTYWGKDERVIGAGVDDIGIGPTSEPDTIMTVVFLDGAKWIKVSLGHYKNNESTFQELNASTMYLF